MRRWRTLAGTLFCAALAAVMAAIYPASGHRTILPLLFIVVLLAVALRFGAAASVLGAFAAALIFAYFLFAPIGSLKVETEAARQNLAWMLLLGIPAGYFVASWRRTS